MENTVQVNKNDGLKRFVSLIDQYFAMGGNQMQFNVVSKKTLLEAQKDPDKYANLLVRVAGYSAYFGYDNLHPGRLQQFSARRSSESRYSGRVN